MFTYVVWPFFETTREGKLYLPIRIIFRHSNSSNASLYNNIRFWRSRHIITMIYITLLYVLLYYTYDSRLLIAQSIDQSTSVVYFNIALLASSELYIYIIPDAAPRLQHHYIQMYNIHQSSHWRLIILHRHSAVNQNPYTYTSIIVRNENIIIIIKLYRGKNMCFCSLQRDALYCMVLRVYATAY